VVKYQDDIEHFCVNKKVMAGRLQLSDWINPVCEEGDFLPYDFKGMNLSRSQNLKFASDRKGNPKKSR
jgi:hypothetical protein